MDFPIPSLTLLSSTFHSQDSKLLWMFLGAFTNFTTIVFNLHPLRLSMYLLLWHSPQRLQSTSDA